MIIPPSSPAASAFVQNLPLQRQNVVEQAGLAGSDSLASDGTRTTISQAARDALSNSNTTDNQRLLTEARALHPADPWNKITQNQFQARRLSSYGASEAAKALGYHEDPFSWDESQASGILSYMGLHPNDSTNVALNGTSEMGVHLYTPRPLQQQLAPVTTTAARVTTTAAPTTAAPVTTSVGPTTTVSKPPHPGIGPTITAGMTAAEKLAATEKYEREWWLWANAQKEG